MKKQISISLLLICLLSGCSLKPPSLSSLEKRMSVQEELLGIVSDDVKQTKGWPEGSYAIKYLARKGRFELFFVTNLPAAAAFKESQILPDGTIVSKSGGDGKSYTAYVNLKTKHVEKKVYVR